MCRNIRTLHNFAPPATEDEVHAAALQYVRKIAGTTKPSKANQDAFDRAVHEIAHATQHLLDDLGWSYVLITVTVDDVLVAEADYRHHVLADGALVTVFHLAHGG